MDTSILSRTTISVILVFFSIAAISPVRGAYGPIPGPTPIISTDKAVYCEGDTLKVTLSGWNYGPTWNKVEVYVRSWALFGVFYLDSTGIWTTSEAPCLPNQQIGSNEVHYGAHSVSYNVPPKTAGLYALETGARLTGSSNWASLLNAVVFRIIPRSVHHYYVNGDKTIGDNSNAGSKANPWLTITHALKSVKPQTLADYVIIHVEPGTYSKNTNGETFPLILKSYVYLKGQGPDLNGTYTTILDAGGSGAHHVIRNGDQEDVKKDWSVVEGFKIMGGKAFGLNPDDQRGGGVYCMKGHKIVLQKNIIMSNMAEYGAGVCVNEGLAIIHNNVIQDNEAIQWGGGIGFESKAGGSIVCNTIRQNDSNHGAGIYCYDSKPEIRNNVITNNEAKEAGGGIFCQIASPLIASNMINENKALGVDVTGTVEGGGGIWCSDNSSPKISHNAIRENLAEGIESSGGGIYIDGTGAIPTDLKNNIIYKNQATGLVSGKGGGICVSAGSLKVEDCTIFENTATSQGGGINCIGVEGTIRNNTICYNTASNDNGGGIYWGGFCSPQILSNTIVHNSANKGTGGGIWSGPTTALVIEDCIIYFNTDSTPTNSIQVHLTPPAQPSYCCIENWLGSGTQIITNKPKFVPGPYGEYYLDHGTPQSPCINKGSVSSTNAGLNHLTTNPDVTSVNEDLGDLDIGCHYHIPYKP